MNGKRVKVTDGYYAGQYGRAIRPDGTLRGQPGWLVKLDGQMFGAFVQTRHMVVVGDDESVKRQVSANQKFVAAMDEEMATHVTEVQE